MRKFFIAITAAMSLLSASAEVTYKYDESTKTLTFSGDGEMNVYTTDIFGDTYINPEWSNLKDEVEHVVINEGVTDIGKHAFMSFSKLKDVKIASTVEKIDVAAFEGCTSLAEITLPEGLKELGEEAFFECSSLTSISIPKNVTFLPKSIFQSCKSLKNINLGNVKKFGPQVFQYCGFETFEIPEGTKTLSENMFFSCDKIKTIDVPASVEEIESGAFYYCELDTIKFLGETFPKLTGFNNFTMHKEEGDVVISINCNAYTEEAIEAIKSHGGAYDTKIIPAWPDGVEVYSTSNAYGPLTITPVDCDKNLYKLSVDLWTSSYQVTWEGTYDVPEEDKNKPEIIVDLSSPATVIAQIDYVQGGGSSIPTINFSVTKTGMGDVDVEVVEKTSTSHTYKLTATPKEGYEFLYWETYNEGILTEEQAKNPELTLTITATEYIQAFFTQSSYCGKDGGENIAWSIKNDTLYLTGEGEMEDYSLFEVAPYGWSLDDFQYVKVGEGVTTIGDMAFAVMDNIKKIYLPSTLSVIGSYAFTECDELEKIYFSGMTPPSFEMLTNVFAKSDDGDDVTIVVLCDAVDAYKEALADYDVDEEPVQLKVICESVEPKLPSFDDFIFDPANVCGSEGDGSNILWAYDEATGTLALKGTGMMRNFNSRKRGPWKDLAVKNVIVSDGVTNIGTYAFYSLGELENVVLPTTIDSIGYYSFSSTFALKEMNIPEGVKYIGTQAFEGSGVTKIILPSTLEEIDSYAFQYNKCKQIVIPASVTKIGQGAFYAANDLEKIVFESKTPANTGGYTIVTTATTATGSMVKLIVPCDAVDAYKSTKGYQPQYVQGEYPYSLTLSQTTDTYVGSDLGGKPMIQQWPDCETGEAIVSVHVKEAYEFSHWEAVGVTLTDVQAKSETITFTVDNDCVLTAFFTIKTDVDDVNADGFVINAENGRISVDRDDFRIYDVLGRDVTSSNGSLTSGVYVVKCEGQTQKVVVR